MKISDDLRKFYESRGVNDQSWFTRNMSSAIKRIEDHSDEEGAYLHAPTANVDAILNEDIFQNEFGGHSDMERVRREAFEKLALCDAWEANERAKGR